MAVAELKNVVKRYDGPEGPVVAVDGASLTIDRGQFIAIKGPSGCGKTTLLLAAGGLLRPDGGEVLLDGRALYPMSANGRAALRATTLGFVFQQFHLIPYLSVVDNVRASTLAARSAGHGDRAMNMLKRFGLADRAQHVPSQLSTGERQRVALARAMLNDPKLVLADEPTGNLDDANGEMVLDCLARFADAGGAVLLVTHDSRAAHFAHRTLLMNRGRIASA